MDGTRRLPISPLIDTYLVPEAPQGARSDPTPPLATSSAIGHRTRSTRMSAVWELTVSSQFQSNTDLRVSSQSNTDLRVSSKSNTDLRVRSVWELTIGLGTDFFSQFQKNTEIRVSSQSNTDLRSHFALGQFEEPQPHSQQAWN